MAILHQVKGLAHLYSITLETFIYLKDQNDGAFFWRGGAAFGTYWDDRKRLHLDFSGSFMEDRKILYGIFREFSFCKK